MKKLKSIVLLTALICFGALTRNTLALPTSESNLNSFSPSALNESSAGEKRDPFSEQNTSISQRTSIGNFDSSFGTTLAEGSSPIYSFAVQPDGKFLIGGTFSGINGTRRGSLERFNADGTVDAAFNPGGSVGANGAVYVIVVLPSGKIMIAGAFTSYNNQTAQRIARLNADGTVDTSFMVPGTSTNAAVQDMILQPDGKILLSGTFTGFNGVIRNRVARLNTDGTLDTAFNPNVNGFVEELVIQPDGKIVIGGAFTSVGTTSRNSIARLNSDGTVDLSFNVGTGVGLTGAVYAADRQPDGKILIGGVFDNYNGIPRQNVARLNTDGSLDTAFFPTSGGGNGVEFFAVQPDGKIVTVGSFDFNGTTATGVIRLNIDGSRDASFTGITVDDFGYVCALQPDGKILFGGLFYQVNGSVRRSVARLNVNGTIDSFSPVVTGDPQVRTIIQQPDGKILVGGQFRQAGGVPRRNIARFNLDGTLDSDFDPVNNLGGFNQPSVWSIGWQADGRILVGGNFTSLYGTSRNYVLRLNSNGSFDNGFFYNDAIALVRDIEVQTDGKIVLGGFFQNDTRQLFSGVVRLLPNGSYDSSFIGSGTDGTVVEIKLLSDGKAFIIGSFTTYNGISRNRIAKINPDGSLDSAFNPGTGANGTVFDLAFLSNGQIYAGGNFTSFNDQTNTNRIVRLNFNGSVDTSFTSIASGFNGIVYALSLQPDGKILAGGNFNNYNGIAINQLALFNSNGTLDNSFTSPIDSNISNYVYRLYKQNDGKTLVGGGFVLPRNALFRLNSGPSQRQSLFDFDGDGKSDVSVFRPDNGAWYLNQSTAGFTGVTFGFGTDKLVPADYDGDGKTDVAVYRNGTWYLQRSAAGFTGVTFGDSNDIPVPADYDGDGKADIAVFRPSNGTWYIQGSMVGFYGAAFGQTGDKPVAADYDGDGKTDVAVNRSGTWYIQRSQLGFYGVQFGDGNDKLVPADYDGDGKADVAVFRPSNGVWYLQQSTAGFTGIAFGLGTDIPAPADYDGDGKADVAVFRNGTWYLQRSTQGLLGIAFGASTDKPIPNAFVR